MPAATHDPSMDFFGPSLDSGESIDHTHEREILRWLASRADLLPLLLGSIGLNGPVAFDAAVTTPFRPRHKSCDIDLLAVPTEDPRSAVAIQAKRFKVTHGESGDSVSLDGSKLDDLIRQCNETRAWGFDRVSGLVVVMMDGQRHPAASLPYRRSSPDTFRHLYQFVKSRPLEPGIGMVFMEIVQPTMAGLDELGFLAVGIDEVARSQGQTGAFSERVAQWSDRMCRRGQRCNIALPPASESGIHLGPEDAIQLRLLRQPR